jgi:cell division protein FtsB
MPTSTQQRKRQQTVVPRRRLRVRPAYIVLVILMGLFAFQFVQKTQQIRRLAAQEAALQQENQTLQQDSARVRAAIRQYRSPQYVEEEARAAFGYTKPGDTAIQIEPSAPPVVHVRPAPPTPPPPVEATWKLWWKSFFG